MYSEELEKLIEIAVLDGVLTDQERQVLYKKAASLGIDMDEFEVVLAARLFEQQEKIKAKEEKVHKCPLCGAPVESFVTKCPFCRTELKNVKASDKIIEFFDKLNTFEMQRSTEKSASIGCLTIGLWICLPFIMLPLFLIKLMAGSNKCANWTKFDSQKQEFILNYPIPNTKEDILEFITLATSKIETVTHFDLLTQNGKYKNRWNNIWLRKIEQIKMKAELAMRTDGHYPEVVQMAERSHHKQKSNNNKVKHIRLISTLLLVTVLCGPVVWLFVASDQETKKAYAIEETILEYLNQGKIEEAKNEMSLLSAGYVLKRVSAKIQWAELEIELDKINDMIIRNKYEEARSLLESTKWTRIMHDWNYNDREKPLIIQFLQKKQKINNALPEQYRIKVETIEDFK